MLFCPKIRYQLCIIIGKRGFYSDLIKLLLRPLLSYAYAHVRPDFVTKQHFLVFLNQALFFYSGVTFNTIVARFHEFLFYRD